MTDEKPPRKQRAAAPKRKPAPRKPRAQRAAVPSSTSAPGGQARQTPPLPPDLVAHFGGKETVEIIVSECVPDDATAGDVLRLLLEARRLDASLLRRDLYLTREGSRDGAGLSYTVAARRDTLLRYAKRQDDFLGHDEAAIFAKDTFKRTNPDGDGKTLRERAGISHTSGMPGQGGDVVGAWCAAEMRGEPPVVRVLLADDYLGTVEDRKALDPEDVQAKHPDLCMIAAAMSNALRIATHLNDVVGAEELTQRPAPLPDMTVPAAPAIFEEGPVDKLDARILDAYRQAAALDVLLWTPAKVRARLAGCDSDEDRAALAQEIETSVQEETARRRDPVALQRRLDELRAFDPSSLDEDDLREYQTERAAVEQAAAAAGLDVTPATA